MEESDFEGTLILEQLAEVGLLDEFMEAVDSDDIEEAIRLMMKAKIDVSMIAIVVEKMEEGDDEQ